MVRRLVKINTPCHKALTEDFGENEDKNHSDVETGLLGGTADTCIADNTNGKPGSKTSKTHSEASTKLDETSEEGKLLLQAVGNEDGNDKAVDTNDTCHNDGNNVYCRISFIRCRTSHVVADGAYS